MVRSAAVLFLLILCALLPVAAAAQPLDVVGWNTESGDADPLVIAETLRAVEGVEVWGLSEVLPSWEVQLRAAAGEASGRDYESVLGTTGGGDRLMVLFDAERFDELGHFELHDINFERRVRSPLVVELLDRESGVSFLFMVNHLYRSQANRRLEQSRQLREWAAIERRPVIAVGDYNYDWHFRNGEADHDPGYDELVAGDTLTWVRPDVLVPTQCSRFDSVLDFVFAGGVARSWRSESRILEDVSAFCPDDNSHSDHLPVLATFDVSTGGMALRDAALDQIVHIEDELRTLRELVEQFQ